MWEIRPNIGCDTGRQRALEAAYRPAGPGGGTPPSRGEDPAERVLATILDNDHRSNVASLGPSSGGPPALTPISHRPFRAP